jgi:mandelate racemase
MTRELLTLQGIRARPVVVPLKRPVVSKVGLFRDWPMILIDLYTNEGVIGHSYLEPYLAQAARYLVPAIEDLGEAAKNQPVAPLDLHRRGVGSLHLVGREGLSLIAVSGIDMAAWDALAKAADLPLAVYLGGTVGPVPAYNSNGLWLTPPDTLADEAAELVAEGKFSALKLRLGRERLADDLAAIAAVRKAAGADVKLMCDFNQGLTLGDALVRCHALDDQGLYWFEEPITYDNVPGYAQLARELKTPIQLGENLYGPRLLHQVVLAGAADYLMPDMMRIGGRDRVVAVGRDRRRRGYSHVDAPLPGDRRALDARHRDRTLAGVAGLGLPSAGRTLRAQGRPPRRSGPAGARHHVERTRRRQFCTVNRRAIHAVAMRPRHF